MDAEMLLQKLLVERRNERLETIRLNTTKSEQSRKKLYQLRARTAEIAEELELRQQVEQESEKWLKAERALQVANFTTAERKVYNEEIRRGQIALSRVVSPENHPDWREHAAMEFKAKKL